MATYISKVKIGEEEKTVHADYATEADHAETADSATSATSASQAGKLVNKLTVTDADGVEREYDGSTSVSITSVEEAGHAETVDALDHTLTVKTGDNVTRTFDGSTDINLGTVANLDNTMHLPRAQTNIANLSWTEPDGTEKTYDGQLDAIIQKLNLLEAKIATLTVTGTETHNGVATYTAGVKANSITNINETNELSMGSGGSGAVTLTADHLRINTDDIAVTASLTGTVHDSDFFIGGADDEDYEEGELQKTYKRPFRDLVTWLKTKACGKLTGVYNTIPALYRNATSHQITSTSVSSPTTFTVNNVTISGYHDGTTLYIKSSSPQYRDCIIGVGANANNGGVFQLYALETQTSRAVHRAIPTSSSTIYVMVYLGLDISS